MQISWLLDGALLFAFSIPVVMKYRILPVERTPYWLFAILFLLLTINIIVSVYPKTFRKFGVDTIKSWILGLVLLIVVGGVTVTAIADRHRIAPVWEVHDIVIQQEAAMRYLVQHKNPYKETYFGTPVESFHYDEQGKPAVNPALYHFVMPPWYLLFPFVFYTPFNHIIGYFDGRIVLLFCLLGTLFVLVKWFRNQAIARLAIILTALSPGIIDYFIEGRSDSFALFWLLLAVYLLDKRYLLWSAFVFGLALMSKQTVWFAAPFYFTGVWLATKKSITNALRYGLVTLGIVLVLSGPFLLWDSRAFFDSIIYYLTGGAAHGYPISGYGFGMVLYEFGFIKDLHAYYPFIIWQLIFGIPALIFSLFLYARKPSPSQLFISYAVSLLVVWYFSRYLNNSHLGYISSVFALGLFKRWDEQELK